MRQQVIDQIKALAPNTVRVSTEIPYLESGTALYIKNPKTIYISPLEIDYDPLLATLSGISFANEINSVRIYFTTDAKNLISGYEQLVSDLKNLKNTIDLAGASRRESIVTTDYAGDLLVTEIEYRLTRFN